METDFDELRERVAQARVLLSLLALLSLYVDPSLGGLFHLNTWLLAVLLSHLLYSALTYLALAYRVATDPVRKISIGLDLIFAAVIAFSNGGTHKSVIHLFCVCDRGGRIQDGLPRYGAGNALLRNLVCSGR